MAVFHFLITEKEEDEEEEEEEEEAMSCVGWNIMILYYAYYMILEFRIIMPHFLYANKISLAGLNNF